MDESCYVLSVQDNWVEIVFYDKQEGFCSGWIYNEYNDIVKNRPLTYEDHGYATITSANGLRVHIRGTASTHADSMGLLYPGVTVRCLSASIDGWTSVSFAGISGYIKSEFLQTSADANSLISQLPTARITTPASVASISLHANSWQQSDVIGTCANGLNVSILGVVDDWSLISVDEMQGYVLSSYLSTSATSISPPASSIAPPQEPNILISTILQGENDRYTLNATLTQTTAKLIDVDLVMQFCEGYTTNDDITSFNIYINNQYIANIPPYWAVDNVIQAPTTFGNVIQYIGSLDSIYLVPVFEESGEDRNQFLTLK